MQDSVLNKFPPSVGESLRDQLAFLEGVLRGRFETHFGKQERALPVPVAPRDGSGYLAEFLAREPISFDEHVILLIALAPHLVPNFFDRLIAAYLPTGGEFEQAGGIRGHQHRGFLPTGQTALFVLAGDDFERRFAVQQIFAEDHPFAERQVLRLEPPQPGEPAVSGKLVLDPEFVERVTMGRVTPPRLGVGFPAQRLATEMTWDDLVLPAATLAEVRELDAWVRNGDTLLYGSWGMCRKLKRGFRALFHGPPGTGKTLTASLLGASTGRDVYRIDLSLIVSKFIGETEKNLANLFDKAENKDWILFFDEADALFGKRTSVRDAHDRYANQEIAYLLQRVEGYAGLVILASNLRGNIDDAFMRRFQTAIHFPIPKVAQRVRLWRLGLPAVARLERGVDVESLARRYELTGAHIMNVIQYASLRAIDRGETEIRAADLEVGIRRELSKDGKVS